MVQATADSRRASHLTCWIGLARFGTTVGKPFAAWTTPAVSGPARSGGGIMAYRQIDLPMLITVCAWCKPKEPDAVRGSLSHGICPRHLKRLKLEARGLVVKRSRRGKRTAMAQLGSAGDALPLAF